MIKRSTLKSQESNAMNARSIRPRRWQERIASVLVWTMVLHPVLPGVALAGPQDANVVNGDVTIDQNGATTIITASDHSIIEYSSFDIGVNETVQFIQPHQLASVLNRIPSAMPTMINGALIANGRVYIVNPAGVFFGAGASVDVAGLVASAGHISNEDFIAGIDHFTNVEGDIENRGTISADAVALIGKHVANYGTIQAGLIVLSAGDDVLIGEQDSRMYLRLEGVLADTGDQPAVENHGVLDAGDGQVALAAGDLYGFAIHHTGTTRASDIQIASSGDGLVEVSGTLDASNTAEGGLGGSIEVTGEKVALIDATLDASGSAGGGDVRVGGDVRGEGDLRTADRTFVDADTSIRADALDSGDGGTVVVWGNEAGVNLGAISATGGSQAGDGGFVEISSLGLLADEGSVDLAAAAGEVGTLLYDPQNIEIRGTLAGNQDGDDPDVAPPPIDVTLDPATILAGDLDQPAPFVIYESEIEGTVANIELEARNSIFTNAAGFAFDGDVVLQNDSNLSMSTTNGPGEHIPPMSPVSGVDLGNVGFVTSGTGTITIQTATTGGGVTADVVTGALTTEGGLVSVTSNNGSVTTGAITTAGADAAVGAAQAGGTVGLSAAASISAGAIDTSGGNATGVAADAGNGGDGGMVTLGAGTTVNVVSIDSAGGTSAEATGGNAGTIGVTGPTSITTTGALAALGGVGTGGAADGTDAAVTLTANDMTIGAGVSGDVVTLQQSTATTTIDLGGLGAGDLVLSAAELANVTANKLVIGSADAGAIQISDVIDVSTTPETSLISGGTVTDEGVGRITADGLRISSAGATLDAANDVTTLAAAMTGDGNGFTLTGETGGFTIGTVDGVTGVRTANATSDSGNIVMSSADTINVNAAVATGNDTIDPGTGASAAKSGFVQITSTGGSIIGDANGTISTGNATVDNPMPSDTAESGSITLTATSGTVQLAANSAGMGDALATGNATADVAGATATTGDISVAAGKLSSDGGTGLVDVSQGTATATGGTLVLGTLAADTSSGGAGDAGGVFVGSGENLQLGNVTTTGGTADIQGGAAVASAAGTSITTAGADAAVGAAQVGGNVNVSAVTALALGAIDTTGGNATGVAADAGNGGNGGTVTLGAGTTLSLVSVDSSGGTSVEATGGSAGTIGIAAPTSITTTGALTALGGTGTGGAADGAAAAVTLTADDMTIGAAVSGSVVTLEESTAARAIDLGANNVGAELDLSAAELAFVTANQLVIGSADAGGIVVSDAIDVSGNAETVLISGASITDLLAGSITAADLTLTANGAAATIGTDAANPLDTTLSGTLNASATSTGDIFVTESDGLVLGAIDAGTGNATQRDAHGHGGQHHG
jgi:filamentous hemagglutinin family protein